MSVVSFILFVSAYMCTMYVCLFLHGINTLAYMQCMILYRVMNWALFGNFIMHKLRYIAVIELQIQMWPKLFISACTYRGSDHDGAWWWGMATCCSIYMHAAAVRWERHMHIGTNCKEVQHVSTYAYVSVLPRTSCVHKVYADKNAELYKYVNTSGLKQN